MRLGISWLFISLLGACAPDDDLDGTPNKFDCAPNDPSIHVDAEEVCDGTDNNCNGQVDEDVAFVAYWDRDGDGFGDPEQSRRVCRLPDDGSEVAGDCDDQDPFTHPGADEFCDAFDNDCDGEIDEEAEYTYYEDLDGDGHGNPSVSVATCLPPEGYSELSDDCDDNDPLAWENAPELCDDHDNNCNGQIDEDLALTRVYIDDDGDGAGDPGAPALACGTKSGFSDDPRDCDDTDPNVGPHATDVQGNGLDEDCDGYVDEYGVPLPFATLQEALAAAPDGSVVQLDEGVHRDVVDLTGRALTLAGEGCDRTVLEADQASSVVTADGGNTVVGLTLTGGLGTENPDFRGGRTEGGGMLITGTGVVHVQEVCVRGNVTTKYGGGISVQSGAEVILEDSMLDGNVADHQGGGLFVWYDAVATVTRTRITGNEATRYDGGGVSTQGGHLTLTNVVLAGNEAGDDGGALHVQNEETDTGDLLEGSADIAFTTFHGNTIPNGDLFHRGGAIHAQGLASVTVTDSLFSSQSQRIDLIDDEDGATVQIERVGFSRTQGSDTRLGHLNDAARGEALFIQDSPLQPTEKWDFRLRPGSDFQGAANPVLLDVDGSSADLGAFGGPSAPPNAFEGFMDDDGDGLADGWELRYGTNPWIDDALEDPDADGLTHAEESDAGTDPWLADTDLDGVEDGIEWEAGLDPMSRSDHAPWAVPGPDQLVMGLQDVELDGSASWDPNGDTLTYAWSISTPALSGVSGAADPSASVTSFRPDVAGDYVVELTVSDGHTEHTTLAYIEAVRGWIVPDDVPTIQDAIDLAGDGDGIGLRPGVYSSSLYIEGKDVTLVGLGVNREAVTLDAQGRGRAIELTRGDSQDSASTLRVASMTLRGGQASWGGGIHATDFDRLDLVDVLLTQHAGVEGGGALYLEGGRATLDRVEVRHNWAPIGGGILADNTTLAVRNSLLTGNAAEERGGAILAEGGATVRIEHSILHHNYAPMGAAGAAGDEGTTLRLDQVSVSEHWGGSLVDSEGAHVDWVNAIIMHDECDRILDGDGGASWSMHASLFHDIAGEIFPHASLEDALADALLYTAPGAGLVTFNSNPYDDLWSPRIGSAILDGGLVSKRDVDGSLPDLGPHGASVDPVDSRIQDTDGDGMEDRWEIFTGLDPLGGAASFDTDGDGLSDGDEHLMGTHPAEIDSDHDGVNDLVDALPLAAYNHRPTAYISGPTTAAVGEVVTWDPSPSTDPNDDPLSFTWSVEHVPEEASLTTGDLTINMAGAASWIPDAPGVYRLKLEVSDANASGEAWGTLRVD